MTLFTDERARCTCQAEAREVFDVTGAGDTVIATLAVMLAAGARPASDAVRIANRAAGIVVGKLGTADGRRREELFALKRMILRRHRRRRLHRLEPGRGAQRARHHRRSSRSTTSQHARQVPQPADCEIADYLDKREFLAQLCDAASWTARRGGAAPGRLLRHDGDRRPLHDGEQLRATRKRAARLVPGRGGAADLRLVGRRSTAPGTEFREERASTRSRSTSTATPSSCSTSTCASALPSDAARRSPACATSTSTARTKRTRGAWPRWRSTLQPVPRRAAR